MGTLNVNRLAAAPAGERGFSFIELLLTIAVLAAVVAIVMPAASDDARVRLSAAASILRSDVEYAQVLSITRPSHPIVVQFDPDSNEYWLAPADRPQAPIMRPGTNERYVVRLGQGHAAAAAGIRFSVRSMPSNRLTFDAHGGLVDFSTTPRVTLTTRQGAGGPTLQMTISPMTGSISEAPGS